MKGVAAPAARVGVPSSSIPPTSLFPAARHAQGGCADGAGGTLPFRQCTMLGESPSLPPLARSGPTVHVTSGAAHAPRCVSAGPHQGWRGQPIMRATRAYAPSALPVGLQQFMGMLAVQQASS